MSLSVLTTAAPALRGTDRSLSGRNLIAAGAMDGTGCVCRDALWSVCARCAFGSADSSRKEVFQPHLPVRLPCYDLAPVTSFTLGRSLRLRTSGTPGSHGLTGGVYKARERIHRAVADARLLANPASWSRVADSNPN